MPRKIDIGGRQGRGNPKPAEHTHSVWLGDLATGAGLLADESYSEPETTDLALEPVTRVERLLLWGTAALAVAGFWSLIVSCAA